MDEIDAVLTDWYEWSQAYQPVAGYSGADSTCRDFRISNQWMDYDDLSETVDRQLRAATGEAVDPIVLALPVRHRIAVQTAVRNFAVGWALYRNPRFPETQDDDYAVAKRSMRAKLLAKNLIERPSAV
ncbi:hypothetical protein [Paraburkholderia xenovorans]|uniref:hypothetical protein n=1 Tax=Paraburkholderia xenovorans TaxID=36873 RepID=UPI0020A64DB9|nr:hypothetical protein [Paraburkholderia xenovorans]